MVCILFYVLLLYILLYYYYLLINLIVCGMARNFDGKEDKYGETQKEFQSLLKEDRLSDQEMVSRLASYPL